MDLSTKPNPGHNHISCEQYQTKNTNNSNYEVQSAQAYSEKAESKIDQAGNSFKAFYNYAKPFFLGNAEPSTPK